MHPQRNAVLNADHLKTEVEYSAGQGATEKAHRFLTTTYSQPLTRFSIKTFQRFFILL
jgi:hypothetical protein